MAYVLQRVLSRVLFESYTSSNEAHSLRHLAADARPPSRAETDTPRAEIPANCETCASNGALHAPPAEYLRRAVFLRGRRARTCGNISPRRPGHWRHTPRGDGS